MSSLHEYNWTDFVLTYSSDGRNPFLSSTPTAAVHCTIKLAVCGLTWFNTSRWVTVTKRFPALELGKYGITVKIVCNQVRRIVVEHRFWMRLRKIHNAQIIGNRKHDGPPEHITGITSIDGGVVLVVVSLVTGRSYDKSPCHFWLKIVGPLR
ncbi:hypothetical protein BDR03DRAFT_985168 [Suillus americanus]|nr:hypothetical protein BDR03DRAFT_985168 [Suillus americanus]